jgi:signal transduction histidine kinase
MDLTKVFGGKVRSQRQLLGLVLLLIASFVGNYCRWTLFFDIDFIFGSIAVWLVVCLYGTRWGTLAGLISGLCTYVIWKHPYTAITFTLEALFVGRLFHRRSTNHQNHNSANHYNNIVLLDALFWLVLGMPLIWLFYVIVLGIDHTQALIILIKQPVNAIFNALIASIFLTHLPIYRWVKRPPVLGSLSLGHTLFNLLFAFVAFPTLILIVLASHEVVNDIKLSASLDLNNASRYLIVEVQNWYDRRVTAISQLAEIAKVSDVQSKSFQQSVTLISRTFSDFRHIHVLDSNGKTIVDLQNNANESDLNFDQAAYFQKLLRSPQPFLSPVLSDQNLASPFVLLIVPIVIDGKLTGAIFSEIDLAGIAKLLSLNIGDQDLNIMIVDQQKMIAASTKKPLGYQKFDWRKNGTISELGGQTYHWLPITGSELVMVKWQNSLFVKEVMIRSDIPWTLIIQIVATSQVRQIEKVHTQNMILLLFVSGLALVFATLVSRQVVKPLIQLAEVTTNLPDKLLEREPISWIQSPVTELLLLVRNFRMMAMSLQQKFSEIHQANELLEDRVQERTKALQDTNEELESEIKERHQVEQDRDRLIENLQITEVQILQLNAELEARVIKRTAQLEMANKELESFSYSVSHDLRAPLRAIDGFSKILQEDYSQALDGEANRYLKIVRDNAKRMGDLIDDLLNLARLSRKGISRQTIFPKDSINKLINDLRPSWLGRQIEFAIADLPPYQADLSLLTQVWINLLSNAIKYTSKINHARIEVGYTVIDSEIVYFIRDNGAGFDMQYADKLFGVFQRMHLEQEFEGTGIGLAIVQRIIHRHGGKIWAEAAINQGATFYFTIPDQYTNQ